MYTLEGQRILKDDHVVIHCPVSVSSTHEVTKSDAEALAKIVFESLNSKPVAKKPTRRSRKK